MEYSSSKYRRIISKIPHPNSLKLLNELEKNEPVAMTGQPPVIWKKAIGFQVFDPYGNIFIDFTSGVLVANCGHNHPEVQNAIIRQVKSGLLTTYIFPNEERIKLVKNLLKHAPESLNTVLLFSTGSEAIEASIKIAKKWGTSQNSTHKNKIISFDNSFHGRTMGAQLAGGIPSLKTWIGDLDESFIQLPFPDGIYNKDINFSSFEEGLYKKNIKAREICAILVEPYQGGIVSFSPLEYMTLLRKWCDVHNVLLVFDEVQSGFGRTGKYISC